MKVVDPHYSQGLIDGRLDGRLLQLEEAIHFRPRHPPVAPNNDSWHDGFDVGIAAYRVRLQKELDMWKKQFVKRSKK